VEPAHGEWLESMLLWQPLAAALVGFSRPLVGGGGSTGRFPILVYLVGIKDPHLCHRTSAVGVAANALMMGRQSAGRARQMALAGLVFAGAVLPVRRWDRSRARHSMATPCWRCSPG